MMDIFTTQLTKVVQLPIKPANLKVKALLKEAGTSKLKEDPDHLENHDYYFPEKQEGNETAQQNEQSVKPVEQDDTITDEKPTDSEPEPQVKHLDLYV